MGLLRTTKCTISSGNIASRIESSSESNRINISSDTFTLIKNIYDCEYRGRIEVKDGRQIEMYFVK
ncbi:adenylate/guanylate cyclase domain-containing protein [Algoriphagus sp. SE2]|uniref:adenylate/guanylate cyclase domain-containing protein n=1 Tax=Algoriphagus sp. SE2 TaxID=3141536 RepID=UPI0033658B62